MTTYAEKLKDPRWQKERLMILERDNFKCQACYDKENTLHVHHLIYLANLDPWEYPDELLATLCKNCHALIKEEKRNLTSLVMPHVLIYGNDEALNFFLNNSMENYRVILIEGYESIRDWHDELTDSRKKVENG